MPKNSPNSNAIDNELECMDIDSENSLIHAAKKGDRSALNQLVKKHYSHVYAFISKKVKCYPDDAQDLTQDTFVEIHRSIKNFEGRSKFSTWIFGIALNIVRNYFNRSVKYKYEFIDSDEVGAEVGGPHNDPEACADFQQLLKKIDNAIVLLPKAQRDALVLSVFEGHSYRETSDMLKITECNLKSRMFRGRRKLLASLDEFLPVF